MMAIKMLLINVGPCVTAFMQVSADVCKGDGSDPAMGGGQKLHFLRIFFMDESVSCNLSRKNAKPHVQLAEN